MRFLDLTQLIDGPPRCFCSRSPRRAHSRWPLSRLEDLKVLNPAGTDVLPINGKPAGTCTPRVPGDSLEVVSGDGIQWTIKNGVPYHVPTLTREVKSMVNQARTGRRAPTP